MDRVLLDTNVIIDLINLDRPHHKEAQSFLERAIDEGLYEIVVPLSSLKDAYYILCRHYSCEEWARDDIATVRSLFEVAELTTTAFDMAAKMDEPDFEDALVYALAHEQGAKAIVSRDVRAFKGRPISRRLPEEL